MLPNMKNARRHIKETGRLLNGAWNCPRKIWRRLRRHLSSEDRAGLYVTIIFHLAVIIVLLVGTLKSAISENSAMLLDFSGQEEKERLLQEEEFRESISRRLDQMISGEIDMPSSLPSSEIRNIAVDASGSNLADDRNTDADKLYADARRLDEELRSGSRQAIEDDMRDETVDMSMTDGKKGEENASEREYKGPSVISYSLDGRKASSLKIPAYRCMGAGDVTVMIIVDNSGRVLNAKVIDEVSSQDECLRNYAVRAARLSRFSASPTAPARQAGEIVYRFIAQ